MNWLEQLVCGIQRVIAWLLGGIVWAIDHLIAGIATVGGWALGLLPTMPSAPELSGGVVEWVGWLVPVQTWVVALAAVVTMLAVWAAVQAALRWARVIG